jgi:methylmalonyl-CoA/ethylmalonyl-CoA epimerase
VSLIRRIDHVAVLVRDTDQALSFYHDRLGLRLASTEEVAEPHVRLTYLDAGNAYLQLVEPLDPGSALARTLEENGEGLHHICFGVDDVGDATAQLSDDGAGSSLIGSGRGRPSAFISASETHGVRIECTAFVRAEDVDAVAGWVPPTT